MDYSSVNIVLGRMRVAEVRHLRSAIEDFSPEVVKAIATQAATQLVFGIGRNRFDLPMIDKLVVAASEGELVFGPYYSALIDATATLSEQNSPFKDTAKLFLLALNGASHEDLNLELARISGERVVRMEDHRDKIAM